MSEKKRKRVSFIKALIQSREIASQREILKELESAGFTLTQATLSRDLKQLKVAKASNYYGNYRYVLPDDVMYRRVAKNDSPAKMLRHAGFISLQFSGNIAVIKTRPGYATGIAYDIDDHNVREIIGTVAGDDTVILVLGENTSRERLKSALKSIIPISTKDEEE